jgi:hypothetical protein
LDLLTRAVFGSAGVRRRVAHELDRRAVRALVRRILDDAARPARIGAEAVAGAPVAV